MENSCIKPEGDGDQMKLEESALLYYIRLLSDGERLWYPETRNEEGSKNT